MSKAMHLLEAHKVLGTGPRDSMDTIKKAYRGLAKRCHPDRGGEPEPGLDFASLAEAFRVVERERQEDPTVSGRMGGGMPVSGAAAAAAAPLPDRKVLRFVSGDGRVVRQEIQVRQEAGGHKEVLAVDLPEAAAEEGDRSPREREEEPAAGGEAEPPPPSAGEIEPARLAPASPEREAWASPPRRSEPTGDTLLPPETAGEHYYIQRSPSREAYMPMFGHTLSRIPF